MAESLLVNIDEHSTAWAKNSPLNKSHTIRKQIIKVIKPTQFGVTVKCLTDRVCQTTDTIYSGMRDSISQCSVSAMCAKLLGEREDKQRV